MAMPGAKSGFESPQVCYVAKAVIETISVLPEVRSRIARHGQSNLRGRGAISAFRASFGAATAVIDAGVVPVVVRIVHRPFKPVVMGEVPAPLPPYQNPLLR